jgi:PDZ domain-containing protein
MRRLRALSLHRRGLTLAIGTVLVAGLVWQATAVKVPYVELSPGPTVNTLGESNGKPIVEVDGRSATTSSGQLRLTTVNVRERLSLDDAVRGWLSGDRAVVPRELVFPPTKSSAEVDEENQAQFKASQTSAETVALRKLGYPVSVAVTELVAGYPAASVLRIGDVVVALDGTPVTSAQKLRELVRARPAGEPRRVTYRRANATANAEIATAKGPDGAPRLGVLIENRQPAPFTVSFDLDRIGGPSAGLMFTLAVIDKLDQADLTGGRRIAGTGTMDDEGNVGPIGGISQKLRGAKRDGASVFLVPAKNCAEAVANPVPGLPMIRVATVDDALAALQALREDRTPPQCEG